MVRFLYALPLALLMAALAAGCGANHRTFVFGGNPNRSPGVVAAPASKP